MQFNFKVKCESAMGVQLMCTSSFRVLVCYPLHSFTHYNAYAPRGRTWDIITSAQQLTYPVTIHSLFNCLIPNFKFCVLGDVPFCWGAYHGGKLLEFHVNFNFS